MSESQESDRSQEPEELSFGSFAGQNPDSEVIQNVSALLTSVASGSALSTEQMEPILVHVFAGLKTGVSSQLAWRFPAKIADYRPLHALNACRLGMHFGMASGLDDPRVVQLGVIGLFYDLSMWIEDLPGMNDAKALEANEIASYEPVVDKAADLLQSLDNMDPLVAQVAREHHERADGTGYPKHSKTDEHHPYSRLFQIIDSFLGMIEPRAFRKALSPVEAMLRLIVQSERGYFHEATFRDWLKIMGVYPVGTFVKLNTGELAIVSKSGGDSIRRPTVEVLADEYLEFRLRPMEIDLAAESAFEVDGAFTDFPKS